VLNERTDTPYNRSDTITVDNNQFTAGFKFDVPAGQRLIVETVIIGTSARADQSVDSQFEIHASGGSVCRSVLSFPGPGTGNTLRTGIHPVRFWVDGNASEDEIQIFLSRTPIGQAVVMVASVHGHLVPLP
jgi:hypothetical protein